MASRSRCFRASAFFAAHIQRNELQQTPDPDLRRELMDTLNELGAESVATSSAVFDVSDWDEACWSDDDEVYERLLERVRQLDRVKRKSIRFPNQERDALLAETAIKRNLVFVTKDPRLAQAVTEFGGQAFLLHDFIRSRMASSPLT
jgi:hypothetical protein